MLRTGDVVLHDGRATIVTRIETLARLGDKHGTLAASVPWTVVVAGHVIVDLLNGHWARGNRLSPASASEINEYHQNLGRKVTRASHQLWGQRMLNRL